MCYIIVFVEGYYIVLVILKWEFILVLCDNFVYVVVIYSIVRIFKFDVVLREIILVLFKFFC